MQSKLWLPALLVSGAAASPFALAPAPAAACKADNCLRAVRATAPNVRPAASQASADCQAFFRSTVTAPIPTTTVTVTASPQRTSPDSGVGTISTEAVAYTFKRRSATTDGQIASSASLPAYIASSCGNAARYSSACACAGLTSYAAVTASPSFTLTVTSIVTPTSIPSPTTTTISTSTTSQLSTSTPILSETSSLTTAVTETSIPTEAQTSTTIDIITTSTSPSTSPACSAFALRATSGNYANSYVQALGNRLPALNRNNNNINNADKFTLLPSGQIALLNSPANVFSTEFQQLTNIVLLPAPTLPAYQPDNDFPNSAGSHGMFCTIPQVDGVPSGPVSCKAWMGTSYVPVVFQNCPSNFGGFVMINQGIDRRFYADCAANDLVAVPACG